MNAGLGLLGVGVALGFMLGSCTDPVPETKVKTITLPPVIKTHVETETEYVTRKLPESCATTVDLMQVIVDNHADIAFLGEQIKEEASQINGDSIFDPAKVLQHEVVLHRLTTKMDSRLSLGSLEAENVMSNQYAACIEDIKQSDAGEDVVPSDGKTTRLYSLD